jgi:uncharacterized protein
MAFFILTCHDKPGSLDLRMSTRNVHLTYLADFKNEVKLAGPLLDGVDGAMIGSHFILEFDTLAQAQSFADNDPYATAGLFESASLRSYRIGLGAWAP